MNIAPEILAMLDDFTKTRHDLHRMPETAFCEFSTHDFIMSRLEKLAPDRLETFSVTGVRAVFYAKSPRRTIAFRADMDALNITELCETDYVSRNPGKMHACGHDGHMTMVLELACLVAAHREELHDNVVLIFQPGEEGRGGARQLIEDGVLKDPDVDIIYGAHLWPGIKKGRLGIRWGVMMAQTCELDFTVYGKSAHGASPQKGVDAVVAAAEFISLVQTAITRSVDPHQDALLTIGRICGGTARNIIADKVVMNATIRVLSDDVYPLLMEHIRSISDGVGAALGAKIEITELMRYPSVDNPRPLVEDFYNYVDMADMVLPEPSMAGEDFAFYQRSVPGVFFFIGVRGGKNKEPLHSDLFDFDEDVLMEGTEVYRRILGI